MYNVVHKIMKITFFKALKWQQNKIVKQDTKDILNPSNQIKEGELSIDVRARN